MLGPWEAPPVNTAPLPSAPTLASLRFLWGKQLLGLVESWVQGDFGFCGIFWGKVDVSSLWAGLGSLALKRPRGNQMGGLGLSCPWSWTWTESLCFCDLDHTGESPLPLRQLPSWCVKPGATEEKQELPKDLALERGRWGKINRALGRDKTIWILKKGIEDLNKAQKRLSGAENHNFLTKYISVDSLKERKVTVEIWISILENQR